MKSYPSIEYWNDKLMGSKVWAFDKLDGSNMRFEWSRKRGWYKFGTRRTMIDENHEWFGDAIPIFLDKYGDELDKIFRTNKQYRNSRSFVVFGEYLGENSFAGQHRQEDKKDVIMFDIAQFQKGWINPKQFVGDFGHTGIPEVIYEGALTEELIDNIKNGHYNLDEGVICKGIRKTKGNDITWMIKIKTIEWLEKLKNKYGESALLEDLNGDITLL